MKSPWRQILRWGVLALAIIFVLSIGTTDTTDIGSAWLAIIAIVVGTVFVFRGTRRPANQSKEDVNA